MAVPLQRADLAPGVNGVEEGPCNAHSMGSLRQCCCSTPLKAPCSQPTAELHLQPVTWPRPCLAPKGTAGRSRPPTLPTPHRCACCGT